MLAWAQSQRLHLNRGSGAHRWWQELAATRALETDADGRLVWRLVILSGPRQIGKSWIEREICAWRIGQARRWGELQNVLHVAHKLIAAQEVFRPAAMWATSLKGTRVRWANGEQQIELADRSRWMIQAATDGAGVAFSLQMALIDEAWRVPRKVFDEAIEPTLAEAESPQTWLVSTAGTAESDLMIANRAAAIASLDDPGDVLLIEWSAPPDADLDLDNPQVWQDCQPHWDERRAERLKTARAMSAERAFRQQWLNQWVPGVSGPLLGEEVWRKVATRGSPGGDLAFGAAVRTDRQSAAITAYGNGTAELVEQHDGAGWVAPRLAELAERHHAIAVGVPRTGPSGTVADEASQLLGNLLVPLTTPQMEAAAGQVYDRLTTTPPVLRLRSHVTLGAAVAAAERRPGTAGWSWALDEAGMVLTAISAAVWAGEHANTEDPLIVV